RAISFSPDGKRLASGGNDGALWLWSLEGTALSRVVARQRSWISSLAFSPSGRLLASAGNNEVRLCATSSGESVALQGIPNRPFGLVAFSPDGKMLAAAGDADAIALWDSTN